MSDKRVIAPHINRYFNIGLSFTVPAGQVIRIKRIRQYNIAAGTIPTISIDGKTMWWTIGHAAFLGGVGFGYAPGPAASLGMDNTLLNIIPIIADEGQVVSRDSVAGNLDILYEQLASREVYNRETDGGTDGKIRSIISCGYQVTSVAAGATVDIPVITTINPAGQTRFPFASVAPPQRQYKIYAMMFPLSNTVGTNLTLNGVRLSLEGRELVSVSGIVAAPGTVQDYSDATTKYTFFREPIEVNSFEAMALFMRVTSTDAGAQDATLECAFLMTEEFLT